MRIEADLEAAVAQTVRRYRAIASLCRQTAAFRPQQRASLLQQAADWERLALQEFEAFHEAGDGPESEPEPEPAELPLRDQPHIDTRWWLPRREGLFAGLQA